MSKTSLGDMSQYFQNLRQTNVTKTRMNELAAALSSGQVKDLTAHFGGDTSRLASIDRELAVLNGFESSNNTLMRTLSRMQSVLGAANDIRSELAKANIVITPDSSEMELRDASARARADLTSLVGLFNARDGERSLFAGNATDSDAIVSAETLMNSVLGRIGPVTNTNDIMTAVDDWFSDPVGGYEAVGYVGDKGTFASRRASMSDTVTLDGRADDPGIRDILRGTIIAAIAGDGTLALDHKTKGELLRESGDALFSATSTISRLQARIGEVEERITLIQVSQSAQKTTFASARNDMVRADPFETATLLQETQRQLELQFTTTARMSQLSLVNYL